MDKREYDQLDALASSGNSEISRLSAIIKNMRDRLESLERNQTDLWTSSIRWKTNKS